MNGGCVDSIVLLSLLHFRSACCVCCHSIVGLGGCFCGMVVSVLNGGDGLCWVEGRVCWCVMVVRVLSCLVVSCLVFFFFFFFFVLVFGVVRAQLCEHARYPRTPLRSLFFLLFSSLASRLSFCWNGGVCLPCVSVFGGHDGYG